MKLSPLGQRLARVAQFPSIPWRLLAENCPVWPLPPPVLPRRWRDGDDRYAASNGLAVLLEALVERERGRSVQVDGDWLMVTNGALDALSLVARHLRSEGVTRAVCAGPVLLCLADLFLHAGLQVVVTEWETLLGRQGWRKLVSGPRDLLYINTPQNPTGACLDAPLLPSLLQDQASRGFNLVFDLVYDSFQFNPEAVQSPLSRVDRWRGIYGVNSFSKNYGAPGLRVGWMIAEPEAVRAITARLECERIAVSTAAQLRAAELCRYGNAELYDCVCHGRRLVREWAAENEIPLAPAPGGTQAWLDLGVGDSERFADLLMDEEHLVVSTGANYYPRDFHRIRVPTGAPFPVLKSALQTVARMRQSRRLLAGVPEKVAVTAVAPEQAGGRLFRVFDSAVHRKRSEA